MSSALLWIVVLLPALAAAGVRLTRRPRAGRAIALTGAAVTLAISCALALAEARDPSLTLRWDASLGLLGRVHLALGLDALSAPFLPLASGVALLVLVAGPRHELDRDAIVTVLLTTSGVLGVVASLDLLVLALFWTASLVPSSLDLRRRAHDASHARASRVFDVFLLIGAWPMLLTVALVGLSRARAGSADWFTIGEGAGALPASDQAAVFTAAIVAVAVRKAVFPLHAWLPILVERGPLGISTMTVATHLGAFLLLRVAIPLAPEAATHGLPIFAGLALASSLYAAFAAVAQRRLLRALGYALTSQLGLVVVGLAGGNVESLHGAMLTMLSLGLSATGLLVIAKGLEARFGTTDFGRLGGLARRLPLMAAAFLLLSVASIGVPGSLGYVAEDLLLHGLLHGHVALAAALLVTTLLIGIVLLRAYFAVFLGPENPTSPPGGALRDLLPREALGLGLVLALLAAGGLAPQRLLDLRAPSVDRLVEHVAHAP